MTSSDSLYTRGKAEGLNDTRASRMPAFFETNNVNLLSVCLMPYLIKQLIKAEQCLTRKEAKKVLKRLNV